MFGYINTITTRMMVGIFRKCNFIICLFSLPSAFHRCFSILGMLKW